MSESRVPNAPLPRPFLRVITEDPITRDDLESAKKNLQQTIDSLQSELKRERELVKKLGKSGEVLQEILAAPDFRALSVQVQQSAVAAVESKPAGTLVDEPPIEYVPVAEIELTDAVVIDEHGNVKK